MVLLLGLQISATTASDRHRVTLTSFSQLHAENRESLFQCVLALLTLPLRLLVNG